MVKDSEGQDRETALEIKAGKWKKTAYNGQVILYSLLISERFKNANKDNILLYIMNETEKGGVKEGFEIIK